MRMKIGFVLACLLFGAIVVNAQGGNFQRRTVEERVKTIHEKFDSTYKFDAAKQTKIDSVFAVYYREQDKIREELRSGGERPDFETMRNKMQPAMDARDKELKAIISEEEFKKWKEQLEPTLMRRPGGGGNRQ
jgi:periplasmic protein CpxP/Spy